MDDQERTEKKNKTLGTETCENMYTLFIKLGKGRGNSPTKLRDPWMKGTHKHTENSLIRFDNHRRLSQSEVYKYIYIYIYNSLAYATRRFNASITRALQ